MKMEKIQLHDLKSIIEFCMDLRHGAYWAFRGQRNKGWDVELHHKDYNFKETMESFIKFKDRCKEFPKEDYLHEDNNWRWLFYAQHYGLKTPLLDWTTNPLVAIYFAVENIISKSSDAHDCGAIWALHAGKSKFKWADKIEKAPEDVDEWFVIKPPPLTNRIVRQSGLFTFHPDNLKFTNNLTLGTRLVKIEIINLRGRNSSQRIRRELGIMNIHHASLFPDPGGVANFVNYELPNLGSKEKDKI